MVAPKLLLGLFLCLLGTTALATTRSPRLGGTERCSLQRLTASQPSQRYEYEGGSIELWNVYEDQFQCVGVEPVRKTIHPNSLSLPSFHPYPRLVFIEQGAVHWTYNDGNQDVVAVAIRDLNNPANQLDMQPRPFYLAGGSASQSSTPWQQGKGSQQQGSFNFQNIFSGFDTELLAEAFNSDPQIVRAMQESRNRGLIVTVQQPMQFVTPDEQQQGQSRQQQAGRGGGLNGLEETICSAKLLYNLDSQREADVYSRQAGKLNYVNQHKLPVLSYLDLSAEKGYLQPNALFSPHWAVNNHAILYVLRGNARVQIVSNSGQTVLDQQVNRGDIVVVPQFFATTAQAGESGFEWVAFKTNRSPMKSPVAGYTSVFRALPLEVITNAYQISPSQAQNLKTNRETESMLFSPQWTSQRS
ncbi:11-S seed storage protein, conserved site-containing protein [Cynara cardunculus var. scolymus]|uniref:11-S seed storage protein, conserved site-containing protein n=1 Tax=Cynara cardunculus var. scolymus TaxID=59895 RepID=A0A103YNJ9_CYNCS|nr:11-S seed storage protein, conserved site-containing protein [Cynara cardunculus var. scolymus]